jgi:cytochrome P450 family 3 subfamily A
MQLNRKVKANAIEVEALLRGIIGKREKAMKEGNASNEDLLGVLMESNIAETKEAGTARPIMTMDDIIGELKLFYFAGMDTTAVLLTWTMVSLSMHPEWQDRAREEVMHVFGNNQPDFDGINQLKVMSMIMYEVLRLYPPVIQFDRQTYDEVQLGGVRYPPGVILSLPIVFLHHDPDVWGEDADEFRPERFAEGISRASKNGGSRAFFPFGWGPRICVGQNFALVEAKMALSKILQRFSFGLSPSYMHAPFPVSTLQPDHGAQIIINKL